MGWYKLFATMSKPSDYHRIKVAEAAARARKMHPIPRWKLVLEGLQLVAKYGKPLPPPSPKRRRRTQVNRPDHSRPGLSTDNPTET